MKLHLYLSYTGSVLLTSKALAIQGNPFDVSFHCGVLAGILRMEEAPTTTTTAVAAQTLLKEVVSLPRKCKPLKVPHSAELPQSLLQSHSACFPSRREKMSSSPTLSLVLSPRHRAANLVSWILQVPQKINFRELPEAVAYFKVRLCCGDWRAKEFLSWVHFMWPFWVSVHIHVCIFSVFTSLKPKAKYYNSLTTVSVPLWKFRNTGKSWACCQKEKEFK